jgi:hypothetical protein
VFLGLIETKEPIVCCTLFLSFMSPQEKREREREREKVKGDEERS